MAEIQKHSNSTSVVHKSSPLAAAPPANMDVAAPLEHDETSVDFSKMKKKPKKSKAKILSAPAAAAAAAPAAVDAESVASASRLEGASALLSVTHGSAEFASSAADSTKSSGALPLPGDDILVFREEGAEDEDGADRVDGEAWLLSDRDYSYSELLHRVFRILQKNNPALACGRKRYTMVPPQVAREGSKKTSFANLADICQRMKRSMEHVIQFLYTELGTSGSVDGAQRLIIKGRFQQKQIENVLRRYIVEYVTCKTCKSPDTILEKKDRLYFMQCSSCGSRRSVSAIKTGFRAQTGSRRAAKAKAA